MLISEQLVSRLKALGLPMEEPAERLQGGDESQVYRMGRFVIKEAIGAADDQLKIEAAGLTRLQNAGCKTPSVHHADQSCLVMDYVSPGPVQEDDPRNSSQACIPAPSPWMSQSKRFTSGT